MADEDDIKPDAADAAADGDGIAEAADAADAPPREPDEAEVCLLYTSPSPRD